MRINKSLRGAFLVLLATSVLLSGGELARAQDRDEVGFEVLLVQGRALLEVWDFESADRISRRLIEMTADDEPGSENKSKAHLFRASYHYFNGDYKGARDELLYMATGSDLGEAGLPGLFDRSKRLIEEWDGAREKRSDHFIVRYVPGKDAVLVEPAIETLEKAYAVLIKDLGIEPGAPVLVEIYPSFEGFQAATNLSAEALEKSGTIAVCKYRRLMINTPRNLLRGYDYRDTLSHEFVHFLIYQKYATAIPIWLHEGLAKYEEERWRGGVGGEMSPTMKSMLASALRENELIGFDRMHPSFAYLETPAQGQLAFAEVNTVIDYLVHTGGWDLVFKLCDELRRTFDYKIAIKRATGKDFGEFWEDWVAHARAKKYEEVPGMEITALEIRKGDESFDEVDEDVDEEDLAEGEEWRYVRLGDLLRGRGHFQAATVEYARAREMAPFSLRILNKIGLAHSMAGDHESSIDPLKKAIEIYPHYSASRVNLGRSYYAMEKYDEAAEAFEAALDINPFNPIPYHPLIKIHNKKGDKNRVKNLVRDLLIIQGRLKDIDEEVPDFEIEDQQGGDEVNE